MFRSEPSTKFRSDNFWEFIRITAERLNSDYFLVVSRKALAAGDLVSRKALAAGDLVSRKALAAGDRRIALQIVN